MTKTNMGRIILGGIVAGIVLDILGFLVDGILLAPQWTAGMTALGKSGAFTMNQIVSLNLLGLANGIFAIWLYAAIRPRYGAGPKAAVFAGLALWVAGVLLPNLVHGSERSVRHKSDHPHHRSRDSRMRVSRPGRRSRV